MKKTIATASLALALSTGLFAAPAHADADVPAECQPYVQVWEERALAAEKELDYFRDKLMLAQYYQGLAFAGLKAERTTTAGLRADLSEVRGELAFARADVDRLRSSNARARRQLERRDARIDRLEKQLARARAGR